MSTGISEAARDRVLRAAIVAELEALLAEGRDGYPWPEGADLTVEVAVRETNDRLTIAGPVGTLERLCALLDGAGE